MLFILIYNAVKYTIKGFVQVLSGLAEQDTVIRVGHHKLQEGDPIVALTEPTP